MGSGDNGGNKKEPAIQKIDLGPNTVICEACKTPWMEMVQTVALRMDDKGQLIPAHAAAVTRCSNCHRIVGSPRYMGELKPEGNILTPGQPGRPGPKVPRVHP